MDSQQRPTGVAILAIWFIFNGITTVSGGLGTMFIPLPGITGTITLLIGIPAVLLGAIYFAIGWGLWGGQNWGLIAAVALTVITLILSVLFGLVLLVGFNLPGIGPLNFPALGIGLFILAMVEGLIIYYLLRPDVRDFFSEPGFEPTPFETIRATPPMPVTVAPPPVSSRIDPRLPATELVESKAPPAAWLVAKSGSRSGQQYGLKRGRNRIGRDGNQCQVILDDSTVSKLHAEVSYENGRFMLYDHAALNGTFVNDRRVQKQGLLDGDEVRLGNVKLVFKEVSDRTRR